MNASGCMKVNTKEVFFPKNSYLVASSDIGCDELLSMFSKYLNVSGYAFWHNCDDCYFVELIEKKIFCLGHCYNPFSGKVGKEAILELLEETQKGEEAFLCKLGELSGRFVIFLLSQNGSLTVFPDACSSIPVTYLLNAKGLLLSSHSGLIKKIFKLSDSSLVESLSRTRFYNIGIRHCPADLTEVEGVKMLTPNLQLFYQSDSISVSRIFPKYSRVEREVDEVVEKVSEVMKRSVECLSQFGKPIHCALSGGVDSRMSLAATVELRNFINFFTFSGDGNASRDIKCTKELADRLQLSFSPINLPENRYADSFFDLYRLLQGRTREANAQETSARRQSFGVCDAFEIRSSVSEVSRSFMKRKFHIENMKLTPDAMVPLYKRVPFSKKWHQHLRRAFAEWMERSSFQDVEKYGYDWLDFYYWEVRVGTWQSLVLQDADYYTNPTVIFCNRKLLDLMLSSHEFYRESDQLQIRIMKYLDKEVVQLPIVKNFGGKAKVREFMEHFYLSLYSKAIF
jgi:hypothetical protein